MKLYVRMIPAFLLCLVWLASSHTAQAQSTATRGVLGYNTTSGCPGNTPSCWLPYDTSGAGIPITGASITSTTAATASATPTSVSAGLARPINIDLNSALFVQPTYAGTPVDGTHGLPINCISGCSGGAADESAFTAGTTSVFTGGFFQTTATNNALTNGQIGVVQMTAQRAFFSNLRNASGTEVGTSTTPLQVSVANTGANSTAMLVTGTAGTFPVTQGTSPWIVAGGGTAGSAATGVVTVQGIASMTKLLVTPDANSAVNVAQINGVTVLMGAGATGTGSQRVTAAQDTSTIAGSAPGTAGSASTNVLTVQGIASMTKLLVTPDLPSGAATSANQTNAAQKTQIVDGSGNVIAATSNALNVQCANCSGSGVSTADEATFTAGTSLFAGSGGFFQTTATNNALTTGQQGMFQVTATRALFSNLRNAAGTEVGTSTTPLQVSVANTGSNATAILTTGTGGTFPVTQSTSPWIVAGGGTAGSAATGVVTIQGIASMTKLLVTPDANSAVNVAQVNGVTVLMGAGATGTGSQRVTAAQDATTIAGSAPGTAGSASTNVVTIQGIASMTKLLVTPDANSAVNLAQVNGVTTSTGTGAVGTGTARVAVGTDTATIAGSAPGTAGTPSANVLSFQRPTSNIVTGANSATSTSATTFTGMGAQGSGVKIYVTDVDCFRTDAGTTVSYVTLNDGSSRKMALPPLGGMARSFTTPLVIAANTAFQFTPQDALSTVFCNAAGYTGP